MSCYRLLIFILLLLFLLLLQPCNSTPPRTSSRNHPNHHLHRQQHDSRFRSCSSFSRAQQRSLCFQLQRIHKFQPSFPSLSPKPPPQPELNEIDPRYGVEKRLVPSGPNPLHN
ncbi:CLAVATA3/ESR (CLE)-related protein 9-like [Durio zibethinus]|uniref:CLAVATA3/ESR (CLE)-related protein 9-like n=1 Tax=Durio zibethinus TaxID=66656 RepID=A0A6P5XF88_DURZI|nr:CLAVATA3/ESR (CLE)-related protein 9-like [Durio zibethinus]